MSRAGETILDLRWKLIPALHWPFTEKVYQLLVCLITSILFKPLYFGVSCNSQSILCLTLQPGCVPQSPLPFSSGTLTFLWSLIVSTILLATGSLPMLFLLLGMLFPPPCLVNSYSPFLCQLWHHLLRKTIPNLPDQVKSPTAGSLSTISFSSQRCPTCNFTMMSTSIECKQV